MSVQGTTSIQDQVSKLQAMAKEMCTPTGYASITETTLCAFSKSVHSVSQAIFSSTASEKVRSRYLASFQPVKEQLIKMRVGLANNTLTTLHCTALFLSIFRFSRSSLEMAGDRRALNFQTNPFAQAVAKHDFNLAQKLVVDNPTLLNMCYREETGIGSFEPRSIGLETSLLNVFCNRRNVEAVDFLLKIGEETDTSYPTTFEWVFNSFVTEEESKSAKAILIRILQSGYDVNQLREDVCDSESTQIFTLISRVKMIAFEILLPILVDEGNAKLDSPCFISSTQGNKTALEFAQKFTFCNRLGENEYCTRALIFNGASVSTPLTFSRIIRPYLSIREDVMKEYCDNPELLRTILFSLEFLRNIPLELRNFVVSYLTLPIPQMRELCYKRNSELNTLAQYADKSQ